MEIQSNDLSCFGGMTVSDEEPGGRPPAPGAARLVQQFINTLDREGPENLADAAALHRWLTDAGLLASNAKVTSADHARAIGLREALRDLAAANAGLGHAPNAERSVNAVARRARLQPVLTADGKSLLRPTASGVDAALGEIVAALHSAIAEGTWPQLKACERHSCRWAFYDRSKNQTARWCATTICGAREKSKRAYRRRKSHDN